MAILGNLGECRGAATHVYGLEQPQLFESVGGLPQHLLLQTAGQLHVYFYDGIGQTIIFSCCGLFFFLSVFFFFLA